MRLCLPPLYNVSIALTLQRRKSLFTQLKNSRPPSSTKVTLKKWFTICDFSLINMDIIQSANGVEDVIHVSQLWNPVPESARQEVQQELVSPQEMDRLHSIQLNSSATVRCNPCMCDPYRLVMYKCIIYVQCSSPMFVLNCYIYLN